MIPAEEERLDVAIDKALDRRAEDIYDEIIVVDDSGYYKGDVFDLRRKIAAYLSRTQSNQFQANLTAA